MKNTLEKINEAAITDPEHLVNDAENRYLKEIKLTARRIADNDDIKIVSIAGPSASGKTTSAHILRRELELLGEKTEVVSLDDFYLPVDMLPVLPDGSRDIESVNALDLILLNKCFLEIANSGITVLPKFDFMEKRRIEKAREIDVSGKGIVIAEGLHALNPIITDAASENTVFKIYISVNDGITCDGGAPLLSSRQIRLARRILRDRVFRSTTLNETLALWDGVVKGEEKYLYRFKNLADVRLKTLHCYEPCIYKGEITKLAGDVDREIPCCSYFLKTVEALSRFEDMDSTLVPQNSLIREFIG